MLRAMAGWNGWPVGARLCIRLTDINIDTNIDVQKAISEMAVLKASGRWRPRRSKSAFWNVAGSRGVGGTLRSVSDSGEVDMS